MKILIAILAVATTCVVGAEKSPSMEDKWGAVRSDTFNSLINGKTVLTRVSPSFIDCGVKWRPGDKLPIDLAKVVLKIRAQIVEKFGADWRYEHLCLDSYGGEKDMWIIQFYFQSSKHGTAVVVCNLKGEIWPFGKVYDEFECE